VRVAGPLLGVLVVVLHVLDAFRASIREDRDAVDLDGEDAADQQGPVPLSGSPVYCAALADVGPQPDAVAVDPHSVAFATHDAILRASVDALASDHIPPDSILADVEHTEPATADVPEELGDVALGDADEGIGQNEVADAVGVGVTDRLEYLRKVQGFHGLPRSEENYCNREQKAGDDADNKDSQGAGALHGETIGHGRRKLKHYLKIFLSPCDS
jgi:hypothetical protein